MQSRTYNPFKIFGYEIERKFTIRSRDYDKYTKDQLNELIPVNVRIFVIDTETLFLAKDVCSILGITPNHITKTLEQINKMNIKQKSVSLSSALENGAQVSQHRLVNLLTEAGVYECIQHSKTTYAEKFKEWLNGEVLPCIRANGRYVAPASVEEELVEINENLNQEEFGARMMSKDEIDIEFAQIVDEGDTDRMSELMPLTSRLIKEKDAEIQHQKELIESKSSDLSDVMKFLYTFKDESRNQYDNIKNQYDGIKSEFDDLKSEIGSLRVKLDKVIPDRIAKPEDDGKLSKFIIYETGENQTNVNKYPYYIVKCQSQMVKINERRVKQKYPNSKAILTLSNPSAESMFQVLKERACSNRLGVSFFHTSFSLYKNTKIEDVIDLVHKIESERVNV